MTALDFPLVLRATHFLNLLFLSLLVRSGFEILDAHPKLYWNDACTPGTEWLRFTRKRLPEHELWTSRDEEESFSSWIALPGHRNLGLGRHWHFLADAGWVLTGLLYVVMLFSTREWRRLVPTSWAIVPGAWQALSSSLSLHLVVTPDVRAGSRRSGLLLRHHRHCAGIASAGDPCYEMHDLPLPVPHGAPLRLRVETQLGFTMVKYVHRIEFVSDYGRIGEGQGGWREDHQYYSQEAGI